MQLQEHRGRLTIALDLDETLLCTYRIEHCAGGGDTLQLVPATRPGTASPSNSGGGLSWFSSLGRTSSGGGSAGSSGGSSFGSYSVSTQWLGLPGELGAAASVSAWMHYSPPAPSARTSSSSGSDGSMDSLPPQQQLPGPHSLAVFLRPGCREFLCQLACFAEVVLFTAASPEYGAPLAELLDPSGQVFRGRLYSDACIKRAGRRGVKDLQVGRLLGCAPVEGGRGLSLCPQRRRGGGGCQCALTGGASVARRGERSVRPWTGAGGFSAPAELLWDPHIQVLGSVHIWMCAPIAQGAGRLRLALRRVC
jgi:hypothetical protein